MFRFKLRRGLERDVPVADIEEGELVLASDTLSLWLGTATTPIKVAYQRDKVQAVKTTNQSFSASVWTKVEYAMPNSQFITEADGLYSLSLSFDIGYTKTNTDVSLQVAIYKNGSLFEIALADYKTLSKDFHTTITLENKMELLANDVVEIYFYTNNRDTFLYGNSQTFFKAVRLI